MNKKGSLAEAINWGNKNVDDAEEEKRKKLELKRKALEKIRKQQVIDLEDKN